MRKLVRRRVAAVLIAAMSITMISSCLWREMPVRAEGVRDPWMEEFGWMLEESVVELDENNMDENGCSYVLKAGDTENTAKLSGIDMLRYEKAKEDITLRVPDKVVKRKKEMV